MSNTFKVLLAFVYIVSISALWAVCRIARRYLVRSPLDNIPGPASKSFWKGTYFTGTCIQMLFSPLSGNFVELFNANAWEFHKSLRDNCKLIGSLCFLFTDLARWRGC